MASKSCNEFFTVKFPTVFKLFQHCVDASSNLLRAHFLRFQNVLQSCALCLFLWRGLKYDNICGNVKLPAQISLQCKKKAGTRLDLLRELYLSDFVRQIHSHSEHTAVHGRASSKEDGVNNCTQLYVSSCQNTYASGHMHLE